jgi:hypothetical protein
MFALALPLEAWLIVAPIMLAFRLVIWTVVLTVRLVMMLARLAR